MTRVVVVGAGVLGASIAARLAERGADVVVVEQSRPGAGASGTSFAWVNANGKEPDSYFQLNAAGVAAHRELATDGADWIGTGGHVEFATADEHRDALAKRVSRLSARGYPAETITPGRAASLLPGLRPPAGDPLIGYFPDEAFVYPHLYLGHMLAVAHSCGAQLTIGKTVVGFEKPGSGGVDVILNDGMRIAADVVVSAVGRWSGQLAALAGLDIPMQSYIEPGDPTVGFLAETGPVPVDLRSIVTSPLLNVRPAGGGRLLLQALDLDGSADPGDPPDSDSALAQILLGRLSQLIPMAQGTHLEKIVVGQRALPGDGRTVVGSFDEAPWFYVAATHSGITLAPFLGDVVAAEIFGALHPLLNPFRPSRFSTGSAFTASGAPRMPGEQ